ncbi:MAG: UMP kinase [Candidatus Pacebacteria bacterium]|nr:UMP kinase [Candidatus Paceibacterota bacterium]MBP9715854.1 UMP kinase [Candidatus Paceibacterota bacterium]
MQDNLASNGAGKQKRIVISLGGSLVVPDEVDVSFLSAFVKLISEFVNDGFKFVIITGGGRTCRNYNEYLKNIVSPTEEDLDWMGIAATRLNAELVRIAFDGLAHPYIILDPDHMPETDKSIIVGGGWKPGNSSDLAAVHVARIVNAGRVINLSNIDFAYDKDPNKYPDAKKIEDTTWAEFRKILPDEWHPGLSSPFDPVAARESEELGLEVVIMNGKNIENLKNYLNGGEFLGTLIK